MFNDLPPIPIRLLLVGAQPALREGLASLLAATDKIQVVGQLDIDLSHLFFIKASPPDVLLVDVDLADGPAIKLVSELRQQFPTLPIVVLTLGTQRGPLRQLLALQIQACLSKAIAYQELVDVLFSVTSMAGTMLVSTSITKLLLADATVENAVDARQASLTKREQAILALILAGKTNLQIAQLLHVNPQTIRNYNKEIYEKLGVNSRVELLLLAGKRAREDPPLP